MLSQEPGRLMFAWGGNSPTLGGLDVLSTEFVSEIVKLTVCPTSNAVGDMPDDGDFVYLGYVLRDDADVRDYAEGYARQAVEAGVGKGLFLEDMPSRREDGTSIYRIREGIERFFITDINNPAGSALAQSQIPTIVEWPTHHAIADGGMGGNVLYMDGHVEFVAYPGKWPMTVDTIAILCELAGREPIKKQK